MKFGESEGAFFRQCVEEEAVEIDYITLDGRLLGARSEAHGRTHPEYRAFGSALRTDLQVCPCAGLFGRVVLLFEKQDGKSFPF